MAKWNQWAGIMLRSPPATLEISGRHFLFTNKCSDQLKGMRKHAQIPHSVAIVPM